MENELSFFERLVRRAGFATEEPDSGHGAIHPFEERNVHPCLHPVSKKLFDDGHYSQATFEAFKFIDKEIARLSKISDFGFSLMMQALADQNPAIKFTPCSTLSEKNEQKGYQFLFAGSMSAIRNPRGHDYGVTDSIDTCLDHLALASLLLRRLEEAGQVLVTPKINKGSP